MSAESNSSAPLASARTVTRYFVKGLSESRGHKTAVYLASEVDPLLTALAEQEKRERPTERHRRGLRRHQQARR